MRTAGHASASPRRSLLVLDLADERCGGRRWSAMAHRMAGQAPTTIGPVQLARFARFANVLVLSVIAGCMSSPPLDADTASSARNGAGVNASPPDRAPDIVGVITAVHPPSDSTQGQVSAQPRPDAPVACPPSCGVSPSHGVPVILIEEAPGESGSGAKARVAVPSTATVLIRVGTSVAAGSQADLRVGAHAAVWFAGPVAESYPVQATAAVVEMRRP